MLAAGRGAGLIALVVGVVIALVGLAFTPLHFLFDYAWFVGFFTAAIVYIALMRISEPVTTPALTATSHPDDTF